MNVYLLLPLHIIDLEVYRQTTLQLEVSNFFFNFEIIIFFFADFATATHISEECLWIQYKLSHWCNGQDTCFMINKEL